MPASREAGVRAKCGRRGGEACGARGERLACSRHGIARLERPRRWDLGRRGLAGLLERRCGRKSILKVNLRSDPLSNFVRFCAVTRVTQKVYRTFGPKDSSYISDSKSRGRGGPCMATARSQHDQRDPASNRFRTRRFTGTPQTASCGCMHRTQRAGAIIRDRDRARTNTADGAEGGRKERETVTGACVASEAEDPISARRRGSSKPRSPLLPPPSPPKGERGGGGVSQVVVEEAMNSQNARGWNVFVTHSGLAGVRKKCGPKRA